MDLTDAIKKSFREKFGSHLDEELFSVREHAPYSYNVYYVREDTGDQFFHRLDLERWVHSQPKGNTFNFFCQIDAPGGAEPPVLSITTFPDATIPTTEYGPFISDGSECDCTESPAADKTTDRPHKPKTELLDLQFLIAMAERMGHGLAGGYAADDWRDDPGYMPRRAGKILRHLAAADAATDTADRCSHLASIACNAMMAWGAARNEKK
jgi:hypothetical protein